MSDAKLDIKEKLQIRTATSQDVPAIVALVESVYRGENSKKGWTTEADLLDGQRTDPEMIADLMKTGLFILAFSGDDLFGSALLEKKDNYAYIGMLSVDVRAQNLKLGRRLLHECGLYALENWQIQETRITVLDIRKELLAWYLRRGYQLTGRTEPFYQDLRYGIPKVNNLLLVEMSRPISLNEI